MRRGRSRGERGIALAATGIFLLALIAFAAIAVEVSRLTDTATEVQVTADASVLGAAVSRAKGHTDAVAIQDGQTIGADNYADGKNIPTGSINIEPGHYDPAAPPGSKFVPNGVPDDAFRSTVTINNVKYIMATVLNGQTATGVQKRAIAAADCPGDGVADLPMAVCTRSLTEIQPGQTCADGQQIQALVPDNGQDACWTNLGTPGSANINTYKPLLPPICNGGGGHELSEGDSIDLQNGNVTSFIQLLQCCVACEDQHKFTVPVIDCANVSSCNQSATTLAFAAINIARYQDVVPSGGGNNNCRQYFPDCNNPIGGTINNGNASKQCVAGCTNAGASCGGNGDCSGCSNGCKSPEGIRINQTCQATTGGSGGGRCFGDTTVILGQQ
jgi:hypothetical protein